MSDTVETVFTVVPPDPEFELAPTKWRVQTAEFRGEEVRDVGSRYFDDFRKAMLYVYQRRLTPNSRFRILTVEGKVFVEDVVLTAEMAKLILLQESTIVTKTYFRPEAHPDRVATSEGTVTQYGLWHDSAACTKVRKTRLWDHQPTPDECSSFLWPCKSCLPWKKE